MGERDVQLLKAAGMRRQHNCPECRAPFETLEDLGGHLAAFQTTGVCERPDDPVAGGGPKVVAVSHCPKCGTVATKLSFDGYGTRWRCTKGGCGHEFRAVAGRVIDEEAGPLAPKAGRPTSPTSADQTPGAVRGSSSDTGQEKQMANELECRKGCGKLFTHEAWRDKHEAKCNGKSKRGAAGVMGKELRKAKVAALRSGSAFAGAIEELRKRRAAVVEQLVAEIPEVKEIDELIEKLGAF